MDTNLPRGSSPTHATLPSFAERTCSPGSAAISTPWWPPSPYGPVGFPKHRMIAPATGHEYSPVAALPTGAKNRTKKGNIARIRIETATAILRDGSMAFKTPEQATVERIRQLQRRGGRG